MYTCLIASPSMQSAEKIQAFLLQEINATFLIARSGSEARRLAIGRTVDYCLINTPLSDEFGLELAIDLCRDGFSQALLMVSNELTAEYSEKARPYGALVIGKPIQTPVLQAAFHWMIATQSRLLSLHEKNAKLQKQMNDLRIISHAKCLLVALAGMNEEQAHKHIEHQAMDHRISRSEVARKIIHRFELEQE